MNCSFPIRVQRSDPQRSKMEPRPSPSRGEYWHSKKPPTRIVCKAYIDPPSVQRKGLASVYTYGKGEELGLIHDVERTDQFVSVRVPDPQASRRLVWVNVWRLSDTCLDNVYGHSFAFQTEDAVVQQWRDKGWTDDYLYYNARTFGTEG